MSDLQPGSSPNRRRCGAPARRRPRRPESTAPSPGRPTATRWASRRAAPADDAPGEHVGTNAENAIRDQVGTGVKSTTHIWFGGRGEVEVDHAPRPGRAGSGRAGDERLATPDPRASRWPGSAVRPGSGTTVPSRRGWCPTFRSRRGPARESCRCARQSPGQPRRYPTLRLWPSQVETGHTDYRA
jgi:hypothetical protein